MRAGPEGAYGEDGLNLPSSPAIRCSRWSTNVIQWNSAGRGLHRALDEPFRSLGGSVASAARCAASAIDAPDVTRCSTAVARKGVLPMLTSATRASPLRVASAPNDRPVLRAALELLVREPRAGHLRDRISVSSSSGATAVSRNPRKKSAAGIVRSPPGPRTASVPSRAT
jgi:hypothetical protein